MTDTPRLLLWGVPELHAGGFTPLAPERRFQLLALLALRAGEWVGRDWLAALMWPGHGNADARRNLRHVVFKARAVDGAAGLEAREHALRWVVRTDLQDFEMALAQQRAADALALRRGPLLAGLDDPGNDALGAWLTDERRRVDARWRQAALDSLAATADPQARRSLAQRLLQADPLDDAAMLAWLEATLALGHVAAAQQAFREHRLRLAEELGVEPSQPLRDLMRAAAGGPAAAATPAAAPALPEDAFVGRRLELVELESRLRRREVRWLTLVGPGGIGKSRLARQLLARSPCDGREHWLDLQGLDDTPAVLGRLALLLGVATDERGDVVERIAARLAGAPSLLVLDNAEHLPELSALVERLLAAAPTLQVLLTSRVRTRAAAEAVFAVGGLALPDSDSRDLEAAGSFDAVRLFDTRARAARAGFTLASHLPAVIEIVEAVGGAPLAIELAAAWVRLLPPQQIACELRGSMSVLERDPAQPGAPARPEHRSVRVVLERTWQLMAAAERSALAALSVFHGSFTAAAAQAVAGAALPLLSSLADQGVVGVDDEGRFALHPLVTAFAAEHLHAQPARALEAARRHAEHYAGVLAALAPHARADHRVLLAGVDAEFANARRAWAWALENARADLLARTIPVWRTWFDVRGRFTDGIALLLPVLDLPERDDEARRAIATARHALAVLLLRKGEVAFAESVAEAGAALAERAGDRRSLVGCLMNLGICRSIRGRWDAAQPWFERSLRIAREDGVRPEMSAAYHNLGICAKTAGRFDEALACYGQALAIDRELGHQQAVSRLLNSIGNVHIERGDWAAARQVMSQGLQHCLQFQVASMRPFFEAALGLTNFELGDDDAAQRHLQRALEIASENESLTVVLSASCFLARLDSRRGRATEALERLRGVARRARTAGAETDLLDAALYYGEWLRDRGRRVEAAQVWQMVLAHPIAEAGIRDSTHGWLHALALDDDERGATARRTPTLDRVIDHLLGEAGADKL
jgi:predicted ATPase/DNA-binding SARP family transcriptional activator/Tfp pilus assembly protein PilF